MICINNLTLLYKDFKLKRGMIRMKGKTLKNLLTKLIVGVAIITTSTALVACSNTKGAEGKGEESKPKVEESSNSKDATAHYPVTITNYNFAGEEIKVTFDKAPDKVITTNQTTTEIMLDLGLEDRLIGTCYLDNPILDRLEDKYKKIPVISEKYPTKEQVLALEPDFIFGWKSVFSDKTLGDVSEWIERGTNTFAQRNTVKTVGNYTVDNLIKDIKDLGLIFNIEDKTNAYVKNIEDKLNVIEDKTSKLEHKKTVLVLEEGKEGEFRLYGKNDLVGDMVLKAGAENLGKESGKVSLEDIVGLNPDAIILVHQADGKDVRDEELAKVFTDNPALQNVTAVKNKEIIITGLAETWAGGVRVIDAVNHYAKELYPDLFK